jgi:peptidoglycan/LPS O-acetylase OafA/YrhL
MDAVVVSPGAEENAGVHVARFTPLHIPSLDGLRAVSFFIVFGAHAGLDQIVPGGFGVTVFFFLSGYLITTLMRVEAGRTGGVSLKHFYMRRALRILPPFYIVLLSATALAQLGFLRGDARLQPMAVASQLLHFSNYWGATHGWSGVATGTSVYWSLAVEEHFYLICPAVFLAMGRLRLTGKQQAFAFWGACAAVLAWRCILVLVLHVNADRTYMCSDTRVDSIAFGCALAVWNNPMLDGIGYRAVRPALWRRILFFAGLGLLLVTFLARGPVFRETVRYTLQGIALGPIFATAVSWPRWSGLRLLQLRPVRFVGTLSYSLYLVHLVALAAVEQHGGLTGIPRAVVALLVSVAIAWAIYRAVERPCARLRRRLSDGG